MPYAFETLAVHAGIEPDPLSGAVMTPIYQTSTFAQSSPGVHKGYEYARSDNPTRSVLQTQLAALEGASHALAFASGMAAIDAVLNLLSAGDHVVAVEDLYGGTRRLFSRVAGQRGLSFSYTSMATEDALREAIRPETKLIWFETPTNPLLQIIDIRMVARVGRELGILTVLDNTFMSPYFQQPLGLGVDVAMHSMTKFLNGHSDVVMGAVMLNEPKPGRLQVAEGMSVYERLKFLQNSLGAVPGPFDCWLVLRGIKTLAIRMQRIGENGGAIANWLVGRPEVERVMYPGLADHPGHTIARSQTSGAGGMISFYLRGGLAEAKNFLSALKLFTLAESLGGVESLAEHPAIMTHASVPADVRAAIGIGDNLIRLSCGIEAAADLMADFEQAFQAM